MSYVKDRFLEAHAGLNAEMQGLNEFSHPAGRFGPRSEQLNYLEQLAQDYYAEKMGLKPKAKEIPYTHPIAA